MRPTRSEYFRLVLRDLVRIVTWPVRRIWKVLLGDERGINP